MERFAFRKLDVYAEAMMLVKQVHRLARMVPREHMDLVWQLRRAVRSILLNIAEGAGEFAPKEKARIYRIARRSAWETVAALDIAIEEGLLTLQDIMPTLDLLNRVIGRLTTMGKRAEARAPRPRPHPRKTKDDVRRPPK